MRFSTFINGLSLSLFLLLQPAKADISIKEAQDILKALSDLMKEKGVSETFTTINTHFIGNNLSPDSAKDQPASAVGDMVRALGNSDAEVFCVKNDKLVASNRRPRDANGQHDVLNMTDGKENKPFTQMKDALKDNDAAVVTVVNVFPNIAAAPGQKSLETQHSVLVKSRRSLIGETEADKVSDEKFFCGVSNVRAN